MKLQGFGLHATSTSLPALDRQGLAGRPTERPNDDMPRIRVRVKEVVMPENSIDRTVSRRTVLKAAAATGLALSTQGILEVLADPTMRLALEEAVAGPTDVARGNPGIKKAAYNVPVAIETNDVLLTVRSDLLGQTTDVVDWLFGHSNRLKGASVSSPDFNGLLAITSNRLMFQQMGLPRRVADDQRLPFAARVIDRSPMLMGFADQQTSGSGPPA